MAINPKIKQKAEDIRSKIFGSEVRESLASGIEAISEDVETTIGRQGYVEEQFQDVLDETTGKDVISAPELIAARNGKSNLKTRLDDEHAQVTAQLQQITLNVKNFGAKGDNVQRPISTIFSTLEEAQATYPCATALTDELDWCAIQTAVDSIEVASFTSDIPKGGGKVFIPEGRYRLNKGIKLKRNIELFGSGKSQSFLVFTPDVEYGIYVTTYTELKSAQSLYVHDLAIESPKYGLFAYLINRSRFERLTFISCSEYGIFNELCVENKFDNIHLFACKRSVLVRGSAAAMNTTQYFTNLYISNSSNTGVSINGIGAGVQQCTFKDVIVEYSGTGLYVDGGTKPEMTYMNTFENFWFEQNSSYDVQLSSGRNTILKGIYSDRREYPTSILITLATETHLSDIKANIVAQANAGNVYFDGFIDGTVSIDRKKAKRFSQLAIPDTSGEDLMQVERELNKVKQALRNYGVIVE